MHSAHTPNGAAAAAAVAAQPCAASAGVPSSHDSGVLVLGGGVLGMGVAFQLLRAGYKHVTIVADKFSPDTTSDVAGASIVVDLTARSSAATTAAAAAQQQQQHQ